MLCSITVPDEWSLVIRGNAAPLQRSGHSKHRLVLPEAFHTSPQSGNSPVDTRFWLMEFFGGFGRPFPAAG